MSDEIYMTYEKDTDACNTMEKRFMHETGEKDTTGKENKVTGDSVLVTERANCQPNVFKTASQHTHNSSTVPA